jgi:hypothetical protein
LADDAVTNPKIATDAVTQTELAADSVGSPQIQDSAVQTTHFDPTAVAPQATQATNVQNVPAEVIVDDSGLTILNGKLTLQDVTGQSVLTPLGFAGSWIDFISSGAYNGQFRAGSTGPFVGTTETGGGATDTAYANSLSANIPGWVFSALSGSASYGLSPDRRALRIQKSASGVASVSFYQDVPYSGATMDLNAFFICQQAEANVVSIKLYTSSRDISHGLLGAETLVATLPVDPLTGALFTRGINGLLAASSTAAKFIRLRFEVAFAATASLHTAFADLTYLSVLPSVYRSQQFFSKTTARDTSATDLGAQHLYIYPDELRIVGGDPLLLSTPGSTERDLLKLRPLAASDALAAIITSLGKITWAGDVTLERSTAGRLKISGSNGTLYINNTHDVGLTDNGSALILGDLAAANIAMDGNEIMARNNGAASDLFLNIEGGDVQIGASATRITLSSAGNLLLTDGYIKLPSIGVPASAAAGSGRLFMDTSGGKVRFRVIFPSGVAQTIAVEP